MASEIRDLEELLDASPNAPPSPPRGNSADLLAHQHATLAGWSPRITAVEESSESVPPSFDLGAASLAMGTDDGGGSSDQISLPLAAPPSAPSTTTTTTPPTSSTTAPPISAKEKKLAEKKARAEAFAKANPNKVKNAKTKKPKLSKAERRALQEKQREAKEKKANKGKSPSREAEMKKSGGSSGASPNSSDPSSSRTMSGASSSSTSSSSSSSSTFSSTSSSKATGLFSHLPPYQRTHMPKRLGRFSTRDNVHPSFARIGLKFSQGQIVGGNNRCVALLHACKDVITDYQPPPQTSLTRTLNNHLKPMIDYIVQCRPLSTSMGNAIRLLKRLISSTRDLTDEEAREFLLTSIDDFIDKRITMAGELIVRNLLGLEPHTTAKIVDGDVVLTHGRSTSVEAAILYAHSIGIKFRVVVVDSRPRMEGRALLNIFAEQGIPSTYSMLGSVAYTMRRVTKVILGASAMMANGTALSRVGTAVVAMMGHAQRIPIIFCCETYKFHERVQLDAIVSNEVADPNDLIVRNADPSDIDTPGNIRKVDPKKSLEGWSSMPSLSLLNISYDLTPQEFITVVATEVGMIPTTSVPVIIREFLNEGVFE